MEGKKLERVRKDEGRNKGKETESRVEGVEKVGWLNTIEMDRWMCRQKDRWTNR